MALKHLKELGHKEIAFMKGPASSSDSEDRWKSIGQVCRLLNIPVRPELTLKVEGDTASPELGYPYAKQLLSRGEPFTALFAYNDSLAIGAIRAIHEAGLRVPEDISVVGFDDIVSAAYCIPPLTTVRQPLEKMGEIAARTLLDRIENSGDYSAEIAIEPEFVVRRSTARPRAQLLRVNKEKLLVSAKA
jgi:LacI family transcriptional regulator